MGIQNSLERTVADATVILTYIILQCIFTRVTIPNILYSSHIFIQWINTTSKEKQLIFAI